MTHSRIPDHQRIVLAAAPKTSARSSLRKIGRGSLKQVEIISDLNRRLRACQVEAVLNPVAVQEGDHQPKFALPLETFHT
jgi:hypothetical protein